MERYELLMSVATKEFRNADHMVYVTYPLINDPKLIFNIAEHLFDALKNSVNAIMEYEFLYKRINSLPDNFERRLDLFEKNIIARYKFDKNIVRVIRDLLSLIEFRRNSPVEFRRKEKYIVCSSNYSIRTLNLKKVKDDVVTAKNFIIRAQEVLRKNGL